MTCVIASLKLRANILISFKGDTMNTLKYSALLILLFASPILPMESLYKAVAQTTGAVPEQSELKKSKKPAWLKKLGPALQAICKKPKNSNESNLCDLIEQTLQMVAYEKGGNHRQNIQNAAFELVKNTSLEDEHKVKEMETVLSLYASIANETYKKCNDNGKK